MPPGTRKDPPVTTKSEALLISQFGWRSAFWINAPVILAVVIAGRLLLSESPKQRTVSRPDYLGASFVTVALAALALGISQSERWRLSDSRTIGSIVFALVLVVLFVRRQASHPEPIVDLTLFRFRSFTLANISSLLFFVCFSANVLNNVLFYGPSGITPSCVPVWHRAWHR